MISDGSLPELVCAVSDDKHFYKEPITLTNCGHSVCKSCLPKQPDAAIKCKTCGLVTKRDFTDDKESVASKALVKVCLKSLYSVLEKETIARLNKFKGFFVDQIDTIDLQIKTVEEEIELKIESIKAELDKSFESFKSDLQLIKIDIINNQSKHLKRHNADVEYFEKMLNDLKIDIENKEHQNETQFYEYQDNLKRLNTMIKTLNETNYQLKFKPSNIPYDEKLIGKISYHSLNTNKRNFVVNNDKLREKLKYSNFDVVQLTVRPHDICVLPNNQLICCAKTLTLYDENYYLLKEIDKIDNKPFKPISVTINNRGEIYLSDGLNNCVVMLDLDFNKIKSCSPNGSFQFTSIEGICFKGKYLYVCDFKRIYVLSQELDFVDTIQLDYNPWKIKLSETMMCVNSANGTYFYSLTDSFELRHRYNRDCCRISEINSCFYEFSYKTKKICCYDSEGVLIEEINAERFGDKSTAYGILDGCVLCFNRNTVISFHSKKLFIKI